MALLGIGAALVSVGGMVSASGCGRDARRASIPGVLQAGFHGHLQRGWTGRAVVIGVERWAS